MKSKSTFNKMPLASAVVAGLLAVFAVGCNESSDPAGAAEDAVDRAGVATREAADKADDAADAAVKSVERDRTAERLDDAAREANEAIKDSKKEAAEDLQRGAEKAERELQKTNNKGCCLANQIPSGVDPGGFLLKRISIFTLTVGLLKAAV